MQISQRMNSCHLLRVVIHLDQPLSLGGFLQERLAIAESLKQLQGRCWKLQKHILMQCHHYLLRVCTISTLIYRTPFIYSNSLPFVPSMILRLENELDYEEVEGLILGERIIGYQRSLPSSVNCLLSFYLLSFWFPFVNSLFKHWLKEPVSSSGCPEGLLWCSVLLGCSRSLTKRWCSYSGLDCRF